ncbi:MAG: hypothetical protein HY698_15305 [Deltaproteobacteria bacterium]|nr:hypothetical protein [Deltaproteobacteria bacterium]
MVNTTPSLPRLLPAHPPAPLDVTRATSYLIQLLQALQFIHARHFVHSDIKTQNIRVTPEGTPKLVDARDPQRWSHLFVLAAFRDDETTLVQSTLVFLGVCAIPPECYRVVVEVRMNCLAPTSPSGAARSLVLRRPCFRLLAV